MYNLRYIYRLLSCITGIYLGVTALYLIFSFDFGAHGILLPPKLQGIVGGQLELDFITDISTFFGVILGIAIPFGIEIVQTVSKNFSNSKALRQRFRDEWQMRWLVPFYIATALWAIMTRLFVNETHSDLQRAVSFTLLACLLFGFVIFARYIQRLYLYTLEQENLKVEYKKDLLATIGTDKNKFQSYVEGFGDIAVTEAKNNDAKSLLTDTLPFLEKLAEKIVPRGDLKSAEKFLLDDEFWELYEKGKQAKPEDGDNSSDDLSQRVVDYTQEAKMRLAFNPGKYIATYVNTLQQLERVYRAGIEVKDSEITRNAAYSYLRILKYLTSEPERGLYIDILMQKMTALLEEAIIRKDASRYSLASDWYTSVVFDRFSTMDQKFRLEYLDLADKYLYRNLQYLVTKDQKDLFVDFISHLTDGGMGVAYADGVWKLSRLPVRIERKRPDNYEEIHRVAQQLVKGRAQLRSRDDLEEWLKQLAHLRDLVVSSLGDNDNKKKAEKQYRETLADTEELYKSRNMMGRIFSVAVYCMFKQKYDYIKEVLDYKQPEDSDASWGGADVQPTKPNDVIGFYYRRGFYERDHHFAEGHHGSEGYANEYFLVLLLNALKRNPNDEVSIGGIITPYRLSDIVFTVGKLTQVARDRLGKNAQLVSVFNFSNEDIESLLIPTLQKIKSQAEVKLNELEQTGDIDDEKIQSFRDEVLRAYDGNTVARKLFEFFGKSEFKKEPPAEDKQARFGLMQIDDKAAFFKEWNVSYVSWGSQYGSNLANSENRYIYDELKSQSSGTFGSVQEALASMDITNVALLVPSRGLYYYEDQEDFVGRWNHEPGVLKGKEDLNGYVGYMRYGSFKVPVYEMGHVSIQANELLVIDFGTVGKLKVFGPQGPENIPSDVIGSIAIRVDAFSKNEDLIRQYLEKPPKWLREKGDDENQKAYLMKKVLIRIYERFRLAEPSKPSVFVVKHKEEDTNQI